MGIRQRLMNAQERGSLLCGADSGEVDKRICLQGAQVSIQPAPDQQVLPIPLSAVATSRMRSFGCGGITQVRTAAGEASKAMARKCKFYMAAAARSISSSTVYRLLLPIGHRWRQ